MALQLIRGTLASMLQVQLVPRRSGLRFLPSHALPVPEVEAGLGVLTGHPSRGRGLLAACSVTVSKAGIPALRVGACVSCAAADRDWQ